MKRLLAIIAVASLIAGCGGAAAPASSSTLAPATSTATPDPGVLPGEPWLAFQGEQGGGAYGIRLVRLDGTGMRALAPNVPGEYQLHPDWSPDGSQLVFAEVGSAATDLWTIDADGGNAKHIVDCTTGCSLADEPAWSPDGTTIAFHRQAWIHDEFVSTLELYDVASGTTRVLLTAADDRMFYGPRWSPDDRLVVEHIHRTTPGKDDGIDAGLVVIVDTKAAHPAPDPITSPDVWFGNPEWSPDGRTIVAFRPVEFGNFDGPADLWSFHPDGTATTRLTHLADDRGQALHPAWASDGTRIAFVASSPTLGEGVIVTIAADGSDLRPVTTGDRVIGAHPRLRPVP